ncbi:MAG: tetratricopeptide repeat protein [Halanaerobiales bacterium]|nr:tetratricopeptide repeat protein [Halanaerobiales bacterium]
MQANFNLIETLFEKAQGQYSHKDYSATINTLKNSIKLLEEDKSPLKGQISFLLAQAYFAMTQYRKARKSSEEAKKYFLSLNQISNAIKSYHLISQCFYHQGRYEKAIKVYQQTRKILHINPLSAEEKELNFQIHYSVGLAAQQIQAIHIQKVHFLRSFFIAKKLENPEYIAQSLLSLGICFFQKQKYISAKKLLIKALKVYHQLGNSHGKAHILLFLGQIYIKNDELQRAYYSLRYAYDQFERFEDRFNQANSLVYLALISLKVDTNRSQSLCNESSELLIKQSSAHSERNSEITLGKIHMVFGLLYDQTNQNDLAHSYINYSMEIFEKYHCKIEYQEALNIHTNLKPIDHSYKSKKKNILSFKLGLTT